MLVCLLYKYKGYYTGRKIHSVTRYFEKRYDDSLKLFRKLHYCICRSAIDKEACDFYQSRISKLSISDLYYDNLLGRADKNYPLLIKKIEETIEGIKEEMSIGTEKEKGEIIEIRVGDLVHYL